MQKLNEVREKVNVTNKAFELARKKAHKAKLAFERVKNDRHSKFIQCFDYVANEIDAIYKVCLYEFVLCNLHMYIHIYNKHTSINSMQF